MSGVCGRKLGGSYGNAHVWLADAGSGLTRDGGNMLNPVFQGHPDFIIRESVVIISNFGLRNAM